MPGGAGKVGNVGERAEAGARAVLEGSKQYHTWEPAEEGATAEVERIRNRKREASGRAERQGQVYHRSHRSLCSSCSCTGVRDRIIEAQARQEAEAPGKGARAEDGSKRASPDMPEEQGWIQRLAHRQSHH